MQKINIAASDSYKQMTRKAVASIVFFIFTYILLVVLALALTALCVALGLLVIYAKPMFLTIMLGLGLACMGLLILVFLVKFIFKKHKEDRSHLVEVSEREQPRLFGFIREIVEETGTAFPKKIYLSDEVNAAVFYDSSFWSMFFPVRKNLIIGVGLVNSTTVNEFKAILAHEFGHFSQRSMKVGSYVHNVNQVIHNMLYENNSYGSLISSVASAHVIIAIFANLAVKIVQGIQWVLRKAYKVVNLSHLSLSREMEFHADAVAAHVAGSQPLITSLQRLGLSQHALQVVQGFYSQRSAKTAVLPANVYAQQSSVMQFLAKENQLDIVNNLPDVPVDYGSRYYKSKLIIGQEWVSHPSTKDRVAALEKINIVKGNVNNDEAFSLFEEPETVQELFTKRIFPETPNSHTLLSNEQFETEFIGEMQSNMFDKLFNGYYDSKNWVKQEGLEDNGNTALLFDDLFNDEAVDKINTENSLKSDMEILANVQNGVYHIRSFEYDGYKYPTKESAVIAERLRNQQADLEKEIAENDRNIHLYFKQLAQTLSKSAQLEAQLQQLYKADQDFEQNVGIVNKLVEATNFIHETTPFSTIELNIADVKLLEEEFKAILTSLLDNPAFSAEMKPEVLEPLNLYLSKDWIYFYKDAYLNHNLQTLFTAINTYHQVLMRHYFRRKKEFLDFLASLERERRNTV